MFLEYQDVHGNMYGTHRSQVEEAQKQGKICILDIDVKGAIEVASKIQCNYLVIQPPSIEELRKRLLARGTDSQEVIEKRVGNADNELKSAKNHPEIFGQNSFLVNDDKNKFIKDAK